MRLIDIGEALRMINNSKDDNPFFNGKTNPIWEAAHNCAISCIMACPTIDPSSLRPKGEWISVGDRLPNSMDDVLVWYEYRAYNGSGGLSERKVKEYGIGCYIPQMGVWSKDPGIGTEARVIAWMPLPEPPGGEA